MTMACRIQFSIITLINQTLNPNGMIQTMIMACAVQAGVYVAFASDWPVVE